MKEFALGGDNAMARWPEFLPRSDHLLFQARNADLDRRGVYLHAVNGDKATARRIIGSDWAAHYGSGYLLFLDGSTLMAQPFDVTRLELSGTPQVVARAWRVEHGVRRVSASATGVLAYTVGLPTESELRWLDRAGRIGDLVAAKGDYVDLSLSPDQSRVAYSRVDPQLQAPDVWIQDLTRGTSARIASERLVDASADLVPQRGADHLPFESLVHDWRRAVPDHLESWRRDPGGSTASRTRARNTPTNVIPCYWSPDGQIVFYQATMAEGYGF